MGLSSLENIKISDTLIMQISLLGKWPYFSRGYSRPYSSIETVVEFLSVANEIQQVFISQLAFYAFMDILDITSLDIAMQNAKILKSKSFRVSDYQSYRDQL